MSAGFSPDTSAAAFPPKSTFAFTFQVKPGKFQNPFYLPIGSASIDCQPFFNRGISDKPSWAMVTKGDVREAALASRTRKDFG
jgi:hypothetical protein